MRFEYFLVPLISTMQVLACKNKTTTNKKIHKTLYTNETLNKTSINSSNKTSTNKMSTNKTSTNISTKTLQTKFITRTRTRTNRPIETFTPKPKVFLEIPIKSGNSATLTYFTDSTTQCYGSDIPSGNALAINPLLLGFTRDDWINRFSNVESSKIPWCGKELKITVNGMSFTGIIVDTCDPVGSTFPDPITGELIGGKCDYDNVIDLYGENGRQFLQETVGDDFYTGDLSWELV